MLIVGAESLHALPPGDATLLKLVFNANGAILFPATEQHRDQKMPGLSYEDDYRGNALAATLSEGKIDVRYHERFSAEVVASLIARLADQPELALLKAWRVTYQGRALPS
jgi:hypothetical protein